jgi:hypothetical protein
MHVLALFLGDGHVLYFEWGGGRKRKKGSNKSNIDYLASENHIDGGRSRCLRLVNKRDPFIGQKQGLKI